MLPTPSQRDIHPRAFPVKHRGGRKDSGGASGCSRSVVIMRNENCNERVPCERGRGGRRCSLAAAGSEEKEDGKLMLCNSRKVGESKCN